MFLHTKKKIKQHESSVGTEYHRIRKPSYEMYVYELLIYIDSKSAFSCTWFIDSYFIKYTILKSATSILVSFSIAFWYDTCWSTDCVLVLSLSDMYLRDFKLLCPLLQVCVVQKNYIKRKKKKTFLNKIPVSPLGYM